MNGIRHPGLLPVEWRFVKDDHLLKLGLFALFTLPFLLA